MKMSYVVYAAMAAGLLVVAVAIGYLQTHIVPAGKSVRTAEHSVERKRLERQRGAVGTAAVAGTTTQ